MKDPYAGITSQRAALAIGNRYDMIIIAAQRMRELNQGHRPQIAGNYNRAATALLEIEQGLVGKEYLTKRIKQGSSRRKS